MAGLGDKTLTSHRFRHLLSKTLLENAVSLEPIRDVLGHPLVQSTEIYAELENDNSKTDYYAVKG